MGVEIRIVIGLVSIFRGVEEWRVMLRVFRPDIVRFPMFEFLPVIGTRAALAIVVAWLLSALAFTIGVQVRISGLLLAATMGATLFIDQQLYFSHLYLLTLIVLLLAVASPENGSHTSILAGLIAEASALDRVLVRGSCKIERAISVRLHARRELSRVIHISAQHSFSACCCFDIGRSLPRVCSMVDAFANQSRPLPSRVSHVRER
jgi:hypothetical protein